MSENRGRVRQLTPYKELREFFEYLYGERAGYVYAPTKDPENGDWSKNFFRWPEQKRELIQHFNRPTDLELYYSPALWSSNTITRQSFLGVSTLWTEMDYGIPTRDTLSHREIPYPTLRIRSSTDDHQHWYWKLDYWESDPDVVEKLTKRLAYACDADLSCWDYQQVLRPPTTKHQESGKLVTVLEKDEIEYGFMQFANLPEPPETPDNEEDFGELPEVMSVMLAYKWPESAQTAFRQPKVTIGKRSDTMCFLAYTWAEMGMSDPEIMALLLNVDDRWGKFKKRNDRVKCLKGIIQRARYKYPVVDIEDTEDEFAVFGFQSFLDQPTQQVKWIVEGVIATETINMVVSMPGVGKTQFTLRLGTSLALDKPFLDWEFSGPKRGMFLSLDMGNRELHHFINTMSNDLTVDEMRELESMYKIVPLGEMLPLNVPATQAKVLRLVDKFTPDVLYIDTFGLAVGDEISSEKTVNEVANFLKSKIIKPFGTTVWFLHHNRKPQGTNKKPKFLEDIYGNQVIGGHLSAGIGLWKDKPDQEHIEVNCLKNRLGEPWTSFDIVRTEYLNFQPMLRGQMPQQETQRSADRAPGTRGRRPSI